MNLKNNEAAPRASAILILIGALAVGAWVAPAQQLLTPPAWMPDLEAGFSERYNDNIYGVSGLGMQPEPSWISTFSPRIGFNLVPLLDKESPIQTLSLAYAPDFVIFHEAPGENHDAHHFDANIGGSVDDFKFSLTNDFLYNDGSRDAPIYALNQIASGPLANQLDRFRSQFADTPARERRDQFQDHEGTSLQYDVDKVFFRVTSALLLYNMDTYLHNTSKAPYLGYQNYPSRYDVHGGPDIGYRVATNFALTLGYRYGAQYQQQLPSSVSSDFHYSSGTYQQMLFGVEGQLFRWFKLHVAAGPDFRDYNPDAPVSDHHAVRYYGEAGATVTVSTNQHVDFSYLNWSWVSSGGNVPEEDSSYILTYRWSATRQLQLSLGLELLQADYTIGDDDAGSAPSFRIDRMYEIAPGIAYAFTSHLSASLTYAFDAGNNELSTIQDSHGSYKNFTRNVVSLGMVYKF